MPESREGFLIGDTMQCFKPIAIVPKGQKVPIEVPCGRCMGCRIAKRREWSVRILHELSTYKGEGVFITLTYRDELLPINGSLEPRHLMLFWKRLRKYYKTKKLRYYACGEYGETTKRPHYHAIVFGLTLADLEGTRKNNKIISLVLNDLWIYGYNVIGTVTNDSAQYVAGYIEKKLNGDMAVEEYEKRGVIAPFSRMSQGIGGKYAAENAAQIIENLDITINGNHVGIPRYYKLKLNIDPQTLYEKGQEKRDEVHDKYTKIYSNGGEIAVDKLRREIASYRYEALRAKLALKTRTLDNNAPGSTDPGAAG